MLGSLESLKFSKFTSTGTVHVVSISDTKSNNKVFTPIESVVKLRTQPLSSDKINLGKNVPAFS